MTDVKRIFFLTEDETKKLCEETGDQYILNKMPHYELESGVILYARGGVSDFSVDVIYTRPHEKMGY